MKSENMVRRPVDRRGIVLILALGMLALFTVVAITLASISRTQATAAGNFKRLEQYGSNTLTVRPDEVNDLFRYALNQLVYDTRNRQSAIRGHSLLRDMYGSPTTYSMTYGTGGGIQSLASIGNNNGIGDGAELRLKRSDLLKLLNITSNNDPRLMALDYQKVYNGTGVFSPRKIDFTTTAASGGLDIVPATGITAGTFIDNTTGVQKSGLNLTNSEIAAQLAFMNVPGRLMPSTPTSYPTNVADWKAIFNPFSGTLPTSAAYWLPLFPINYTEFDAFSPNGTIITRVPTVRAIDPERFTYVVNGVAGPYPQGDHWFGADEDYDYPDVNNMFLAMERADGKMLIPSFHRPGIIAQVADGVNTLTSYGASGAFIGKLPWQPYSTNPPADFHGLILRPRVADRDAKTLGIASPRAGRFREMADSYVHLPSGTVGLGQDGLPDDLDGSGFIGDHPTELDVDTDGDGQNDSVWVDLGAPVIQVGDSAVKPLFAFKVIGMDGKINLNAHGNLYKAPTPETDNKAYNWGPMYTSPANQYNYPLLHKSNLGASPAEINPQYAIILGDNPGVLPTYLPTNSRPPNPNWAIPVGTAGFYDPYQRLLEGYTNLYTGDQAAGRWTGRPDSITGQVMSLPGIGGSDDNGNLTNPTATNYASLAKEESFDRTLNSSPSFNRNFEYAAGDGAPPIGSISAPPAGTPAVHGLNSPVDFYGLGTKYSPFSYVVQSYEPSTPSSPTLTGILPGALGATARTDPSFIPFYLNYAAVAGGALGATIKSLNDGKAPSTGISVELIANGLRVERLLSNEPTEVNLYNPTDDTLYTAADIAALLRANDFDGSASQSRLTTILPDQLARRAVEISAGSLTQTPLYFSAESYGRRRMQNLFTHENWDLIRFNAPPVMHSAAGSLGAGSGLYFGSAVAGSSGELLDISGDTSFFANNPVEAYLARTHSGGEGPNFISQLLNYKLPANAASAGAPLSVAGTSPYVKVRDAYEQLSLALTIDKRDFLIPYDVQMGRRFDLNRPLTAYTTGNAGLVDTERESFAQQIYVLLAIASGACGYDVSATPTMSVQARLAQSRVLAQIAVNIVDYIDPDNVMTLMHFDPDLSDGWDDTSSPTAQPLKDSASAIIAAPGSKEFASLTQVIGFELPQLVINESLSIIAEDVVPGTTPETDEILLNWVELFNPWPNVIDPVDSTAGTALIDLDNKPVFLLQVNRLDATDPDVRSSTSAHGVTAPMAIADPAANDRRIVNFTGIGAVPTGRASANLGTDGGPTSAPGRARVLGRGSGGKEYFVIGPPKIETVLQITPPTEIDPLIPQTITNDYTASAFANDVVSTQSNKTAKPLVEVRLYRRRNPLAVHNAETNPFVVIDKVSQQYDGRPSAREYTERKFDSTLAASVSPSDRETGLYFIKDKSTEATMAGTLPPDWATGTPPTALSSFQRRQPWHGYNSDWRPYSATIGAGTPHPFVATVFGKANQNLEGAFLGLPSLSETLGHYVGTAPTNFTVDDIANGMRQNGFVPDIPSFGVVNNSAYKRWEAFPFLNRQLATPLELLSVRLYGSHMWFLSGGVQEWRLRFTDDFEFFPHPWRLKSMATTDPFYERSWRSRQIPWYQDSRVNHPTLNKQALPTTVDFPGITPFDSSQVQLPLPHLYRFFEMVECRSRMNNGIPASQQWVEIDIGATGAWPTEMVTPVPNSAVSPSRSATSGIPALAAAPTKVLATRRAERTPGKINLNLITEEEVYRGLLDAIETAYYEYFTDYLTNRVGYESGGNYSVSLSMNYWPTNYWNSLFSPLGLAPLSDNSTNKVLDVVDVIGRMVVWSSLTLNNTTGVTVATPPLTPAAGPTAGPVSTGGLDLTMLLTFSEVGTIKQTASTNDFVTNLNTLTTLIPTTVFKAGSPNRQFPGIINGPDTSATFFPGTDPNRQVHSEMYRAFLLSRSGPDGIHGTADDKPFRSFASDDVSDTILRTRNSATNGLVKEGAVVWDATALKLKSPSLTEAQAVVTKAYVDGSDDLVKLSGGPSFYVGDYMMRLGGQRSPGLFDPIVDPYSEEYYDISGKYASIPHLFPIGANPTDTEFQERLPTYTNGSPEKLPVDYWVLEERRNELLAKISGNVTTRSHVFAVWMAVGFFRVEPGTEGLKVPLLGAEVGSESGKAFRHRAFFIIDRSQAKSYDPEDIDANFDFDIMRQKKLLEYYKIIE
jgi:hypothetical protein